MATFEQCQQRYVVGDKSQCRLTSNRSPPSAGPAHSPSEENTSRRPSVMDSFSVNGTRDTLTSRHVTVSVSSGPEWSSGWRKYIDVGRYSALWWLIADTLSTCKVRYKFGGKRSMFDNSDINE